MSEDEDFQIAGKCITSLKVLTRQVGEQGWDDNIKTVFCMWVGVQFFDSLIRFWGLLILCKHFCHSYAGTDIRIQNHLSGFWQICPDSVLVRQTSTFSIYYRGSGLLLDHKLLQGQRPTGPCGAQTPPQWGCQAEAPFLTCLLKVQRASEASTVNPGINVCKLHMKIM